MIHTEPEIVDLTPEERERLAKVLEERRGEPLGGVADTLLYEDDRVKIWSMVLEPGEVSPLHRHDLDYYLCISEGDKIAAVMPHGEKGGMYACRIPPEGNTVAVKKGTTEWAVNIGSRTYREILVELKDR